MMYFQCLHKVTYDDMLLCEPRIQEQPAGVDKEGPTPMKDAAAASSESKPASPEAKAATSDVKKEA